MTLLEALVYRRFQTGQVQFEKSTVQSPHVQKIAAAIAAHLNIGPQVVLDEITKKSEELKQQYAAAPLLVETMNDNLAETMLFDILWKKIDLPTNAPKFNTVTFMKLVRFIQSEHTDGFWPLKSMVDKRRLKPVFEFIEEKNHQIGTAAATPDGTFYFNIPFCQKLMDYAYLKQIKPKGKKYVCNGGNIPDEYAYMEFIIMHEFMHYTEDDFYYQRIIPNSNHMINNWTGDFRSNYLLVKSGYEQLPMGLFNDHINYDRQKTFEEMYRIVEAEFNKLSPENKDSASKELDKRTDDHKPGNEEADKKQGTPADPLKDKNVQPSDIDKKAEKTKQEMEKGKDQTADERKAQEKEAVQKQQSDAGQPGSAANSHGGEVDYTKIRPTFSWDTLVKRFLATATKRTIETYSRPSRRGVGGLDIMRQQKASAIKPAQTPDQSDAKLFFCFDSSGSMQGIIGHVYSNAVSLLSRAEFKNSECVVLKYASNHSMFKVNFSRNRAGEVSDFSSKVRKYDKTALQVFKEHITGGTLFSAAMATEMISALKQRWNVLIFIDADNIYGENFTNLVSVIKASPKQVFVIFDSRNTYLAFRQAFGGSTPNITYFDLKNQN